MDLRVILACLLVGAVIAAYPVWAAAYRYGIGVGRYREARDHDRAQQLADDRAARTWDAQSQVLVLPVQALPAGWAQQPAPQVIQALPATEET